ncbi:hypothetical protein M431DRAFT_235008 [Trichoderma harzianum CBS 226.95]|uniref:Uncharacterized protein n=1 Tax=Trichoderma harzianum CBS 226.95 TaxID=983964 RepID=A0A2T4A230_TRIHA|nr:hypothetical protein M431DRAFT_235008 [Trichoderma harzianum CBS 226.95]PTB51114.1 hypothetical protein M431DRAFT_235008 [Trichoderma harzianum CBS 226.95]
MTRNASIACKSSCMIDRLVHAPPSSTVCEASESTLCCCCRQTLPLVLVLSARPAAHSRGRMLRDPPSAGQHSLRCSSSSSSLFLCLHPPYSYLMVRPHPRAPVFCLSRLPASPVLLDLHTNPDRLLGVLDALDIDSISSFYGSFILL